MYIMFLNNYGINFLVLNNYGINETISIVLSRVAELLIHNEKSMRLSSA